MTGSGRLSLRARLLVLLICVTAAFLLIMGAVTAVALNKRLASQFNADLVATATRKPQALAGNSNGYLAAAVSVRTGQVVLFTPGTHGTEFQQAVSQLTAAQIRRDFQHQPFPIVLADGTRLRAVARPARSPPRVISPRGCPTPTTAPRWAGWAGPSTPCWTASSRRSGHGCVPS